MFSRRALIADVRRERTAPADLPGIDGLAEPVVETRPLPVVHRADVEEHPSRPALSMPAP